MRSVLKIGTIVAASLATPMVAEAGRLEGTGIGADIGAAVAGPIGAVVGGVVGYNVGGPNIITRDRYRRCWRDDRGRRHCGRR